MKRITLLTLRANCSSMGSLFSYFDGSLQDFLTHIKEIQDNSLVKIRLASVSSDTLTMLSSAGVDGSFYHVLDNFAVNHIRHRHGGKRELLRGQSPVTEMDFHLIPYIVANYDSLTLGLCPNGNKAVIYTKDINDETITLVEEIRPGHSELATCTLYKRKKKLTDAKSPADSADSGFASFLQR